MSLDASWERVERWYSSNAPELLPGLYPGASMQEIEATERLMSVTFPEELRQSLLRHNGASSSLSINMMEFLSAEGIAEAWAMWRDLLAQGLFDDVHQNIDTEGDRVLQRWWHEGWIPIASDGAGNFDCVDISPGINGVFGQVINLDHETIERGVIASSIAEWLDEHIDELKSGDYVVFDGELMERQDVEIVAPLQ